MLPLNTKDLIDKSKKGDRKAQQILFNKLSTPMMGVCMRYLKNQEDAEDVLLGGFYKVFKHLKNFSYTEEKRFFGWVKKIMVNESLMKLRRDKDILLLAINEEISTDGFDLSSLEKLAVEDLLRIIKSIPIGYRTVFNLYEIEGYSHKEISKTLNISIGTSKSQLFKAKKLLREILKSEDDAIESKHSS